MHDGSPATPGWLSRSSITRRLSILSTAAIVTGLGVLATVVTGSLLSLDMIERDNHNADQALHSALLEKDFASLQRDAFRHALLRTDSSREGFEGNVEDMKASIETTAQKLGKDDDGALAKVASSTDTFVATMKTEMASGAIDHAGAERISAAGDVVDANIEAIRNPVIARSEAISAAQHRLAWIVLGLTAAICVLAGMMSYLLARAVRRLIVGELEDLRATIARIEAGELDALVPFLERRDEIGDLGHAAERLRTSRLAAERGEEETRAMISMMGQRLHEVAEGDLTVALPDIGESYRKLRGDFNRTVGQLRETLLGVARSTVAIKAGSGEFSASSDDLAQRTERQANDLAQVAASVHALSEDLSQTAQGAATAHERVEAAVVEAQGGGRIVGEAVGAMQEIEKSTAEIGNIISVIDGIAFQTNLLALNAGVEAARAGEAGKGFAVVATEVRALAQRTTEAAGQVRVLIETSTQQVAQGATMVQRTGDALDRIIERIANATDLVTRITQSAASQSSRLHETNGTISAMDVTTQQNAAMVEEGTAAARNLANEADNLSRLVGQFRLGDEGQQQGNVVRHPAAGSQSAPAAHRPLPIRRHAAGGGAQAAALAGGDADWSEF